MIQVRFNTNGSHVVRLPKAHQRAAVIELAQQFVAYEQTRPEGERNPVTAKLEALLDQALPCANDRICSERRRMTASEAAKRLDAEARHLVRQIWFIINSRFSHMPEQADAWGFKVKQSTGRILLPQSRAARLALLSSYLEAEEQRPEHERFTMPDLNEVRRLRDDLAASLKARDVGETQRTVSVNNSHTLARQLHNFLQLGLAALVSGDYDFTITPELKNWGFDVVGRNGQGNGHSNGHSNGQTNGNGHDA